VNHHVARFVVWGHHTRHLLSPQPWDYAFGHGSLLERFVELDGKILLLGCDHDTVTFLHYAEHIVDIPNKRVSRFKVPVADQGVRVWREMEEFDTSDAGAHPHWPARFFARIADTYLERTMNRGGHVGSAESFLFDARGLLALALTVMTEVAADPRAADRLLR
jgi:aminoglycoside 3-N-acetyltransferase